MPREIDVSFGGPVASAIAEAVGDAIEQHGWEHRIQHVSGDSSDDFEATYVVAERHDILAAAYDALTEHHPEKVKGEAETEVVAIDGGVGETITLTVEEWPEDAGGDN